MEDESDMATTKRKMPPQLTTDARREHLRKAAEVRAKRVDVKRAFNHGELSFLDIIRLSRKEKDENLDQVCSRLRVNELIRAKPGIGRRKCDRIMSDLGIAPTRCVGGLGKRQIENLADIL